MSTKAETTGKASLSYQDDEGHAVALYVGHADIGPESYANVPSVVACLLANPEARMAVLASLGHVEEVEARVVAGLEKRVMVAESRLPHLEEAAELLRNRTTHVDGVYALYSWMEDANAWANRDQALSVPTAESGKDVIVDGKPDGAPLDAVGSQDGVAPTAQQTGQLAGSVEATAGEALKVGDRVRVEHPGGRHHGVIGTVLRIEPSGAYPYAVSHAGGVLYGTVAQLKPAPVAEAPERVTHNDARRAWSKLGGPISDCHTLAQYIAQQESESSRLNQALTTCTEKLTEAGRELGRSEGERLLATGEVARLNQELGKAQEQVADLTEACADWRKKNAALRSELAASRETEGRAKAELGELRGVINTPHTDDWFAATRTEAAHQIERWGTEHDEGKAPADWFWLLGFLGGKALASAAKGDIEKAKHHTISTAAVLLNWFRSLGGESVAMRPGIADPQPSNPTPRGKHAYRVTRRGDSCYGLIGEWVHRNGMLVTLAMECGRGDRIFDISDIEPADKQWAVTPTPTTEAPVERAAPDKHPHLFTAPGATCIRCNRLWSDRYGQPCIAKPVTASPAPTNSPATSPVEAFRAELVRAIQDVATCKDAGYCDWPAGAAFTMFANRLLARKGSGKS